MSVPRVIAMRSAYPFVRCARAANGDRIVVVRDPWLHDDDDDDNTDTADTSTPKSAVAVDAVSLTSANRLDASAMRAIDGNATTSSDVAAVASDNDRDDRCLYIPVHRVAQMFDRVDLVRTDMHVADSVCASMIASKSSPVHT
jgi:hypothetical protein